MANINVSSDTELAAALATAQSGDTIILAAGTYSQSHVVATSGLTIVGPKVGVEGSAPLRGFGEANLTGGIQIAGADVTVDGVQISGSAPLLGGFPTGLRVDGVNVSIVNALVSGVAGSSSPSVGVTLAVDDTSISTSAFVGYDYGVFGIEGSSAEISNNLFQSVVFGVFSETVDLDVHNNIFTAVRLAFWSNPNESNNLLDQFHDNTITSSQSSYPVQVFPRAAITVTGTELNDAFNGDLASGYGINFPWRFAGLGGDDFMGGGTANDYFEGGDGNDEIDGNDGIDTASYESATAAVTVTLLTPGVAQNTGGAGTDTLSDIENLVGSSHDDSLTGDALANIIWGGAGVDLVFGNSGNDLLYGGAGNDDLRGNVGDDIVLGGEDQDTLAGGIGNNVLDGGSGDDTLVGTLGIDAAGYLSATGAITIDLALTGPQATGGAGTDTLIAVEHAIGSNFGDTISGTLGENILLGLGGADTLRGLAGNDRLFGGANDDQLFAGAGDDYLNGGAGADTLTGGQLGIDTFAFNTGWGNDTIVDFRAGGFADILQFEESVSTFQLGANVLIFDSATGLNSVTVLNATKSQVDASIQTLPPGGIDSGAAFHPEYVNLFSIA